MQDDSRRTQLSDLYPRARSAAVAAVTGAVIGALGVLVAALVLEASDDIGYAPLVGAVAIAVWTAGAIGGVAAILCAWVLAIWALTLPHELSLRIESRADFVRWAVALVVGIVVAGVGLGMRRRIERAAAVAEQEVRSRVGAERLQALTAGLLAASLPEEVARASIDQVSRLIGSSGGAFGLLEGDEIVIVDSAGSGAQAVGPGVRLALDSTSAIAQSARERAPVWAQSRPELVSRFAEVAVRAPDASAALAAPVFVGERLAGAMGFLFAEPDAITEEVRTVALIAADLSGQALERAELYARERESRLALDRILAVAPRFARGATPELVITSVCGEARRAFGCDVAQIWTPLDSERLEVSWRDPPHGVIPAGTTIAFADFPGLMDEMHALQPMFVSDAQAHTRGEALRYAQQVGVFSSLRIPIVIGARFERILTLQWERVISAPAPAVVAVVRRFADQAGLAIEQAQRRQAEEQTRALQTVTEAFAAAATPAEVGRAIVDLGVAAVGARAATVYALTADGEAVELIASQGYPADVLGEWSRIHLDAETPVTDAIRRREAIVCASFEEIAARYPWFDETESSFVAAPMMAAGRVVGAVFVGSVKEQTVADLGLVLALARQAGQALDRAQLFEREQASVNRLRKLQAVTAELSNALTTSEVSRICLEHAAAMVSAPEGVVVLRPGGAGIKRLGVVVAIGSRQEAGEIPVDAAALVTACTLGGHVVSSRGWTAFPLANGALALKLPPGDEITLSDREWLDTLASQGTQALDRAGRYETERTIAETLQRSVLPDRLPAFHGVELAARYLPGTVGVDVGGDWYDAIRLQDGRIGLVVGDVVGKGVQAAAMMAQLRNALRAFAFEHTDCHAVVSRLAKLVDGLAEAPFATLVYLVVDPQGGGVQYVVAGHPPPLVRAPDGTTRFLDEGRTLPIGVDSSAGFVAGEGQLEPGSTVVLYTDGLVERRGRPLDQGLELLAATAAAAGDRPEPLTAMLVATLTGDEERPDDTAVLVLRLATAVIADLRQIVPATQDGLVAMRAAVRGWLLEANVEPDVAADVVLAAWEACANALEHAQRPLQSTFGLAAMLDDGGWLRIEVEDSGQWKRDSNTADRGLGFTLMRSLMETVEVKTSAIGTTIVLERRVIQAGRFSLVSGG